MGAVQERHAGIASGISNTVSRTAGLLAIAVFGIIMLSVFNTNLDRNIIKLPPEAQTQINEQRYKLANIELSADLGEETHQIAKKIVKESFVAGFRVIAYSASCLALLSALSAWFLIEDKGGKKKNAG
jgi:hypothetical protein